MNHIDKMSHQYDMLVMGDDEARALDRSAMYIDADNEVVIEIDTFGTLGSAGTFGGCFGCLGTAGCCC